MVTTTEKISALKLAAGRIRAFNGDPGALFVGTTEADPVYEALLEETFKLEAEREAEREIMTKQPTK